MRHLPGYAGTSSVLAVTLLDELLRQQAPQAAGQRQAPSLRLVGTLAHEVRLGCPQQFALSRQLGPIASCSGALSDCQTKARQC